MVSVQTGIIVVAIGGVIYYAMNKRKQKEEEKSIPQGYLKDPMFMAKKQKKHAKLMDTFQFVK